MIDSYSVEGELNQQKPWLTRHWLLVVNTILGVYIGLPLLAPILMSFGLTAPANAVYMAYGLTCHQFPERSHFIFGHQVALCHRCNAIWLTIFLGGLLFSLVRHRLKPIPFHWWILALIPIGLDGGTQLVGPLYEILPGWYLTGFAIFVWLVGSVLLIVFKVRYWQYYLFLFCFPMGMMYVQFAGTRLSNWQLRSITGAILGIAYVLLLFPMMEESFLGNKKGPPMKRDSTRTR